MTKSYKTITSDLAGALNNLREAIPETTKGFSVLAEAATKAGTLDKKTKELIALGIAVSTRCDGCIGFHTKALQTLGATHEEVAETLAIAIYMGGGPSMMYAADALKAFTEFSDKG